MNKVNLSDSSQESKVEILQEEELSDTSFSKINKKTCAYCDQDFTQSEEESDVRVVGCEMSPRWSHKSCTNHVTLMELDNVDDVSAYPILFSL